MRTILSAYLVGQAQSKSTKMRTILSAYLVGQAQSKSTKMRTILSAYLVGQAQSKSTKNADNFVRVSSWADPSILGKTFTRLYTKSRDLLIMRTSGRNHG